MSTGSSYYNCEDVTVSRDMIEYLVGCEKRCTEKSFTCNGETWYVGNWGMPGPALSIGSGTGTCSRKGSIRPCIGNQNWGGVKCIPDSQTISLKVNVGKS